MKHETDNAICGYSDTGPLRCEDDVPVDAAPVNRVTRAVFDRFVSRPSSSSSTPVTDITPLQRAVRAMLAILPEDDGWRRGTYKGQELMLVPNDVGGLTLMFPEDD
jgi:hypothetical protein